MPIGTGDVDGLEQIAAPNLGNRDPSLPPLQGREGARQLVELFAAAFSSMYVQTEDVVGEGDKVVCRFRFGGVNAGSFMGAPVTGKKVEMTATGIFRIANGQFTDHWVNFDALSMM